MERIIINYLKRKGILVLLRKKIIKKCIDVYLFDFIGVDNKFYSFCVYANETQILDACNLIGFQVTDCIFDKYFRVFDTKKDWSVGKYNLETIDKKLKYFDWKMKKLLDSARDESFGDWRIDGLFLSLRPSIIVTFMLSYKNNYERSYVCSPNTKTLVENPYSGDKGDEFSKFIQNTLLDSYIVEINQEVNSCG